MNIRELKRRLQPYSGYMKPIEDGGADSGGEVIDMAGDADGAGDGAGQEDRGDDFTPTADAEDGADGGETPPASAGAEPDGGDGHDGATASKGIPRGRFNEVNQQRKDALAQLAAANEEIARLKGGREAAPTSTPAPAPAATAAAQSAVFDVEAQEEAYVEALMEGDTKAAVAIRRQINAHLQHQASERVTQELTTRQAEQLLKNTAKSVSDAYPWLNQPESDDVLELILAARDRKIAAGMPPHLALADAANTIAPRFAPAGDTPSGDLPKVAAAKDTRPAAALARGAADSTAQPPALQAGIGQRATATRVNVSQLTEEQFEALTPAEKKRLRGD